MAMPSLRDFLLLVACTAPQSLASASSSLIQITSNNSTCPFRTVNYLTHTLPQQCLTSSRLTTTARPASDGAGNPNRTTSTPSTSTSSSHTRLDGSTPHSTLKEHTPTTTTPSAEPSVSEEPELSVTTVTATAVSDAALVPALPTAIEEASPLESDTFLSFEDWKKQNLQRAGQSEHVGMGTNAETHHSRTRPTNVHNSLDSLGDDAEIELDFGGFAVGQPDATTNQAADGGSTRRNGQLTDDAKPGAMARSKDAGTTCKQRFNYASFDCAANVLKSNAQAKSPNSVLIENKDAYMLNECSADNKYLILELCQDLSIDTIVLANFEFFSSTFRLFRVSVSDKYPVKAEKWKEIGIFEARNTREVQAFLVENPVIWARYIRFEFLTHYGNEYYCPLSLVRVHGTTMLEEYKHDMELAMLGDGDDAIEDVTAGNELSTEETLTPEAIDDKVRQERLDQAAASATTEESTAISKATTSEPADFPSPDTGSGSAIAPSTSLACNKTLFDMRDICLPTFLTSEMTDVSTTSLADETESTVQPVNQAVSSATAERSVDGPASSQHHSSPSSNGALPLDRAQSSATTSSGSNVAKFGPKSMNLTTTASADTPTTTTADETKTPSSSQPGKSKSVASTTQPQPASPTMQESFFKSVQKRLQQLESNSSLSLQYIEEQSRALRDAFRLVEQRQLSKTSVFLDHLNLTVLSELREFRRQYDQLWQSTVIELEVQREQYQRENQAVNARLAVLADELIFQKRMGILQMLLIVVCLGLVLFSKGGLNEYLELPLVQSLLSRSANARWISLSGDTPSSSPKLAQTRSAHEFGLKRGILKGHRRGPSEDSLTGDVLSAAEGYSPPTPVSLDGLSDVEPSRAEDKRIPAVVLNATPIPRPQTSPPVLTTSEGEKTPQVNRILELRSSDVDLRSTTTDSSDESLQLAGEATTPSTKQLKWASPPPGEQNRTDA